jgi:hypothetical protein
LNAGAKALNKQVDKAQEWANKQLDKGQAWANKQVDKGQEWTNKQTNKTIRESAAGNKALSSEAVITNIAPSVIADIAQTVPAKSIKSESALEKKIRIDFYNYSTHRFTLMNSQGVSVEFPSGGSNTIFFNEDTELENFFNGLKYSNDNKVTYDTSETKSGAEFYFFDK